MNHAFNYFGTIELFATRVESNEVIDVKGSSTILANPGCCGDLNPALHFEMPAI